MASQCSMKWQKTHARLCERLERRKERFEREEIERQEQLEQNRNNVFRRIYKGRKYRKILLLKGKQHNKKQLRRHIRTNDNYHNNVMSSKHNCQKMVNKRRSHYH